MAEAPGHNGPTDGHIREAFDEIIGYVEELDSERGVYMRRCKAIREQIANTYDLAKDRGIRKKVLQVKVREFLLTRKLNGLIDSLEDDDRSEFERMSEALGPFAASPLGQAALAGARQRDSEALDDLAH
jgi:hypothetical protein